MSSIVLNKNFGISRDELMAELKKQYIDTRPFFPQMSTFRMFNNYDNPISEHIANNGINLPSGHKRTREEITYISKTIKNILKVK